jgi:hypothetical protein
VLNLPIIFSETFHDDGARERPAVVKGFTEDDREVKHRSDFTSMASGRKVGLPLNATA